MEISSNRDPKDVYRSLYMVAKQLDDVKKNSVSMSQLFDHDIEDKRSQLVLLCRAILFKDYQVVGKKAREILWRKGYYEFIAFVKKNWNKEQKENNSKENFQKLEKFLCSGIANYKQIASNMEDMYDLDLKYLVDFSVFSESIDGGEYRRVKNTEDYVVDKSLEAVSFALDTIHSALLSLGDLHRYFLDFKIDCKPKITKKLAAKFYYEAFKLNPAIGMSQNQLGTLFYGQNYDLDSIYHYLYSLVCIVPFELSENNVCKLFQSHADYLEKLDPNKLEFSLKDFYARFYLIVDIFFFDKEVPDFNSLCHCVLIDMRKILCSKNINISEASIFKIVSILFFCLSKLKMINSQKVYSLNAFLVAVCSDLMDACIVNLEQAILSKAKEQELFQQNYAKKYEAFDLLVRKSRYEYNNWRATVGETEKKIKPSDSDDPEQNDSDQENKTSIIVAKKENDEKSLQNSTRSSDEAKESDLKTPLSNKSKKRSMKLRRRRRKIAQSDDSSHYDSESDMDTDFSSDDDEYSDLSWNFESDFSDIDDREIQGTKQMNNDKREDSEDDEIERNNYPTFSDNEDIVIEEEKIIYPGTELSQEIDSEELVNGFEVLNLNGSSYAGLDFKSEVEEEVKLEEPPKKLIYRNKYTKIDPNIVVDFVQTEPTMRALKILFDWLKTNHEILFGCYHSNPEFIHKIMKLLNYCNIDIFTRKVFFEREFLMTPNIRQGLNELFDMRASIPLSEDFILKNFDLFQSTQIQLDWETTIREKVSPNEENILRIFKMVDFGFFICKQKKFNYRFCVRSRKFIENVKKKRDEKKVSSSRRRELRSAKNSRKRVEGRTRRYSDRKNGILRKSYTSNEEKDTVEECKKVPRKGYLRNRNATEKIEKILSSSGADEERSEAQKNGNHKKCEAMGKLWLKSEVETLEEELRRNPSHVVMTPFIVVDGKSLTEYTGLIKNLVKTKKSIILVPNAVFTDLDELKKRSENARNVIRWLEQEFTHGNRHIRAQREHETLIFPLLKIPRKLDREGTIFVQIAQFCNYLVANHTNENGDYQSNVVTYLSGDFLNEKRQNNFSFTGILDTIPVRHYQISNFYARLKLNKK